MELAALLAAITLAAAPAARAAYRSLRGGGANPGPTEHSLARPQPMPSRAPMGEVARDLRTFDGLIMHPAFALTPKTVQTIFREAEIGYPALQCDLIDDLVENDATLRNLFEQREQSVAGKDWTLQAGGTSADETLGANVLRQVLRPLPMMEVFQHLLQYNRYGWAAVEIDWGVRMIEGRLWVVPTWLTLVPARRFRISMGFYGGAFGNPAIDELRIYTDIARPLGDPLVPTKWIILRRSGTWLARAGLMRTAAWFAMAKRFGFRDWLVYSQRFGLPLPIATYPEGADAQAIDTAERIIKSIGTDGGAVVPEQIKVDFHDATRGNRESGKTHGALIGYCNAEMAKLINGSTLTNDNAGSGGASYALGEVHAKVSWENVVYDAERLQEALEQQLFAPFWHFNDLAGAPPTIEIQVARDIEPKMRTDIAVKLKNELGIGISVAQMRQELGYREPSGPEDDAKGMQVQSFPVPAGGKPT